MAQASGAQSRYPMWALIQGFWTFVPLSSWPKSPLGPASGVIQKQNQKQRGQYLIFHTTDSEGDFEQKPGRQARWSVYHLRAQRELLENFAVLNLKAQARIWP